MGSCDQLMSGEDHELCLHEEGEILFSKSNQREKNSQTNVNKANVILLNLAGQDLVRLKANKPTC